GIVIVSAAGNCLQPITVYPARDPNAVGMAGTNHLDQPWKGTSRGSRIAAAAPAENVRVARRRPDDQGQGTTGPSQGTSFAAALTAGVAALWIEHHGRQHLRDEAARVGITVNDLFRTALKASARRPADWQSGMGAGIVDADALL
ncbi:S8 family serine peptidase, partial [Rhodovulum sulfidophilum]